MLVKKIFLIFVFIILWNTCFAKNQSKTLTLDECISLALKNNFDLKIERQTINEANAKFDQIKAKRLPQINFDASYIRFSEVMETDISEMMSGLSIPIPPTILRFGDEDNYSLKLSVTQPLFTGFRLKKET